MAAISLPFTDPPTWKAIPILGSSGQFQVANPLLDAPCYVEITHADQTKHYYKCLANSSVLVNFPSGALCKAAACSPMTVTTTVL